MKAEERPKRMDEESEWEESQRVEFDGGAPYYIFPLFLSLAFLHVSRRDHLLLIFVKDIYVAKTVALYIKWLQSPPFNRRCSPSMESLGRISRKPLWKFHQKKKEKEKEIAWQRENGRTHGNTSQREMEINAQPARSNSNETRIFKR